jgi:hypothetical protein
MMTSLLLILASEAVEVAKSKTPVTPKSSKQRTSKRGTPYNHHSSCFNIAISQYEIFRRSYPKSNFLDQTWSFIRHSKLTWKYLSQFAVPDEGSSLVRKIVFGGDLQGGRRTLQQTRISSL